MDVIDDWLSGKIKLATDKSRYAKRWLIETKGNKCEQCGWAEINVYTEKDGDYTNNTPSNLRLLCPNCHSLTSTYMALNRGHGRKSRYADKSK